MLRSKTIIGLIKPMRQLVIFRMPSSSYSQHTMTPGNLLASTCENQVLDHLNKQTTSPCIKIDIQGHLLASTCENQVLDHFNKQTTSPCIKKDVEGPIKVRYNEPKRVKSKAFLSTLFVLDDSKESVYGALDAFVAEEQDFPIGRVKAILLILERKKQWHKVVQVIKWMLSKGQGTTVGTYGQLIHALDLDGRVEEANRLWIKKLGRQLQSVPWKVCDIMILVYYRNKMWKELVDLYKDLELRGRKLHDQSIVEIIAEAHETLGLVEEKDLVLKKYKSLFTKTRGRHRSKELSK